MAIHSFSVMEAYRREWSVIILFLDIFVWKSVEKESEKAFDK